MHVWPDPIAAPLQQAGLPTDATWYSERVFGARDLDERTLEDATRDAYERLLRRVSEDRGLHLVRVWNFVPAVTAVTSDGRDRYMAFNAGRFAALSAWFGDDGLLERAPAATGVGTVGPDLVIHALATERPGVALQNARQIPAVRYSARYGPRPPCFARATRLGRTLLVAGTAAICGEDSVTGDLMRQLEVTLDHLVAMAGSLERFASLRAYVPDSDDSDVVHARLLEATGRSVAIELVRAALCRRELRVEIEGVAVDSGQP